MSEDLRYEIKVVANEINFSVFNKWLHIETDFFKKYPDRQINSLYFDDYNFSCVKDNLSGIAQRRKYRLRWYGSNEEELTDPIFEIKIKNGRLGSKRYFNVPELNNKLNNLKIRQIQEIALSKNKNKKLFFDKDLNPSLIVSYKRNYFENNNDIRITVDNDIIFSDPSNEKLIQNHDQAVFNKRIIEFKFSINKKDYVSRIMKDLNIVPSRHSKYLSGLAMFGKVNYL